MKVSRYAPAVLLALLGCLGARSAAAAAAAEAPAPAGAAKAPKGAFPFFALCMDTHDAKRRTLPQQAEMLGELGFDGAAHLWLDGVPERLKTLDARGLELFQVYVQASIDPSRPKYDPRLAEVTKLLKGRRTMLGVLVTGMKPSDPAGDERAVSVLGEIADLAGAAGLRVALYPHTGDWLERVDDAIRVVKKAGRKNLGVSFNLCHYLKVEGPKDPKPTLRAALPHLFVVTINGADAEGTNWDRLILPLDRGNFDVHGMLRTLKDLGYTGPIGLMCYGIGGDAREHLARSMDAWRKLSARLEGPNGASASKDRAPNRKP